jgi:putative flavoprotein involved in K+ transport
VSAPTFDAVVVGGGQAGLATGYHLAERGAGFVILDAADEVGASWRRRWDSLVLFTSTRYDSLPGRPFPGDPERYPTKDEVAEYLRGYADGSSLPVRTSTSVASIERDDRGYAVVTADGERLTTSRVVVATGPFQVPTVPSVAGGLDASVTQQHSDAYRNPASVPGSGPVLVVGGGNSGCQIAHELSATRPVTLAVGSRAPVLPQRPLGRDLWWWGSKLGLANVTVDSRLGRRLRSRDPVIGIGPKHLARDHGVEIRPRVRGTSGRAVTFEDGTSRAFDGVVWATGYAVDHSWVHVPEALGNDGRIAHRRGLTASAGLAVVGQTWQWRRGSALLGWVGEDAAFVVRELFA